MNYSNMCSLHSKSDPTHDDCFVYLAFHSFLFFPPSASYLPGPSAQQYQFVYVDGKGEICSRSAAFTFSAPKPLEELVTLEEEGQGEEVGEDMLLVIPRAQLLQVRWNRRIHKRLQYSSLHMIISVSAIELSTLPNMSRHVSKLNVPQFLIFTVSSYLAKHYNQSILNWMVRKQSAYSAWLIQEKWAQINFYKPKLLWQCNCLRVFAIACGLQQWWEFTNRFTNSGLRGNKPQTGNRGLGFLCMRAMKVVPSGLNQQKIYCGTKHTNWL